MVDALYLAPMKDFAEYSILHDVTGPYATGPSSSHTIAPLLAGQRAYQLLGGICEQADVLLFNSFARTCDGHGTKRAVVAGLMGMQATDPSIPFSLEIARELDVRIEFHQVIDSLEHPNAMALQLTKGKKRLLLKIISVGGGKFKEIEKIVSCVP